MIIPELIYSTVKNKCPRCHKGPIFVQNNPYNLKRAFTMNGNCNHCQLNYEREPGFFYGAMYVSYALMAALLIIWFISDLIWLHLPAIKLALFVVLTMFILFPVAYRWARIIWLNFFFHYDKKYSNSKPIQ